MSNAVIFQSEKGKDNPTSSFFEISPSDDDIEVYKKVINEWLKLHPVKEYREPDKEDIMEEIIELIQKKDDRWKNIKAKNKKSGCKLYKSLYDLVDYWTDDFDKNRMKVKTPPKVK